MIPEPAREIFIAKLEHADRLIALAEIAEQMGGRSFGAVRFADQSLRTVQRAGEIIEFVKIIVAIENFSRLVRSNAECVDECFFEMFEIGRASCRERVCQYV